MCLAGNDKRGELMSAHYIPIMGIGFSEAVIVPQGLTDGSVGW